MAGKALFVDGWPVLPRSLSQNIFMTGEAEGLGLAAEVLREFYFFWVVALGTALGQHFIAVKKIGVLVVGIKSRQGAQGLVGDGNIFSGREKLEGIFAGLERYVEMEIVGTLGGPYAER